VLARKAYPAVTPGPAAGDNKDVTRRTRAAGQMRKRSSGTIVTAGVPDDGGQGTGEVSCAMPLRVVLADDGALFRQALADLLGRAGIQVLAQAGNAPLLLRAVEEHQPDVAIIDIRMPPTHTTEGIRAARQIRDQFPAVGILLLSTHTEIDEAVELFTAAPRRVGYLLKDSVADLDELTGALTRISDGGTVFDPKLVVELLGRARRADPLDALTSREREVLKLMAEGQSNAGIAKTLWITQSAVEKHINRIFSKLEVPATLDTHQRVLAVIAFLDAR
jgi:DNA-binding NarL/FixJ family response regulator